MKIIRDANEMRAWSREQRRAGKTIGLVPTMGALHEGHLSLLRASVAQNDATVISIFVNPAQFAPHEDFDSYPRTFETDCAAADVIGADAVYAPKASAMYPEGYAAYIEVERLQEGLCGGTRPHFFRGVATVVSKLFNAVEPDRAYFGLKDGQQVTIIQRMVRDLDFGVEIVALPTVRETDGLAMSSRNQYLDEAGRTTALSISRSLFRALERLESGERDGEAVKRLVREGMEAAGVRVDYVELVDAAELKPVGRVDGPVMLAVAGFVGNTRLIDNIRFEPSRVLSSAK